MLKVRCPSCGKSAVLPESDAGLAAVCLACGERYTVPEPAPPVDIGSISGDLGTSQSDVAGAGRPPAPGAAAGGGPRAARGGGAPPWPGRAGLLQAPPRAPHNTP